MNSRRRITNTLRATGFLVRNYKMLSREQWLEDTVKHTVAGVPRHHAGLREVPRPHDRSDLAGGVLPDARHLRAAPGPHRSRARANSTSRRTAWRACTTPTTDAPTYFFIRGDERKPDKNRVMTPGVPAALCGGKLADAGNRAGQHCRALAAHPDKREFVIRDTIAASEQSIGRRARGAGESEGGCRDDAGADCGTGTRTSRSRRRSTPRCSRCCGAKSSKTRAERTPTSGRQAATGADGSAAHGSPSLEAQLKLLASAGSRKPEAQSRSRRKRRREDVRQSEAKRLPRKAAKELEAATKKAAEAEKALAEAEEKLNAEPVHRLTSRARRTTYPDDQHRPAARLRPLDRGSAQSADRARGDESSLAAPLWPRLVATPGEFRHAAARAPSHPRCSIGSPRSSWQRLEA